MIELNNNIYLASNAKRFIAYLIDILPIVAIVFLIYYKFYDFDIHWRNYVENREDIEIRKEFLKYRNQIRNISLAIWVLYGFLMDFSFWQGTLRKKIMGVKVVDYNGNRIDFYQSIKRNFSKMLSIVPLFIGIFWIIFDKHKRGWHDMIAKTILIE